jgi:hypothetical protein
MDLGKTGWAGVDWICLAQQYNLIRDQLEDLYNNNNNNNNNNNSVALVRERTIPTERPPLVGEVSANFCGQRVSRGQRGGSLTAVISISRPEPILFLPNSFSIVLTKLSGPRSRSTSSQDIW